MREETFKILLGANFFRGVRGAVEWPFGASICPLYRPIWRMWTFVPQRQYDRLWGISGGKKGHTAFSAALEGFYNRELSSAYYPCFPRLRMSVLGLRPRLISEDERLMVPADLYQCNGGFILMP